MLIGLFFSEETAADLFSCENYIHIVEGQRTILPNLAFTTRLSDPPVAPNLAIVNLPVANLWLQATMPSSHAGEFIAEDSLL